MDITFSCEKCGQNIVVDEAGAGITVDCPRCGRPVYVPSMAPSTKTDPPVRIETASAKPMPTATRITPVPSRPVGLATTQKLVPTGTPVVITDIQIPFWRLVVVMIKWGIASIPAALVLMIISFLVWGFFALLGLGLMMHGFR
jgi:DNA-directed RNA polymerase subunit RPC12/RpoP